MRNVKSQSGGDANVRVAAFHCFYFGVSLCISEGYAGALLTRPVSPAHGPFNKLKSADLFLFYLSSCGLSVVRFNPLLCCCAVIDTVRVARHCFLQGLQTGGVGEQTCLPTMPCSSSTHAESCITEHSP